MNESEFLNRLENLQMWKRYDVRAPHKPLLLLLALTRLANDGSHSLTYKEVEPVLTGLLVDFGPKRQSHKPEDPFRRLFNDGLWTVKDSNSVAIANPVSLSASAMKKQGVSAGFNPETLELLKDNPHLIRRAIQKILSMNFPESYFKAILDKLNFREALETESNDLVASKKKEQKQRDPRFRENVLREYGRQCAICESNIRLQDSLLDLQAAHIMWHAFGGPDQVSNGLALCSFHHLAFDRGAMGLLAVKDDYQVIVSSEINGGGPGRDWLLNFNSKAILKPVHSRSKPASDFVDWHRSEVFKGEPF